MHLVRAGQAANAAAAAGGSQSQRNQSAPRSSRAPDQPSSSGGGATGYSYDFAQRDGSRDPRPAEEQARGQTRPVMHSFDETNEEAGRRRSQNYGMPDS